MVRLGLFVEDVGHQMLLEPLVLRVAREMGVPVQIEIRNATRGHGAVVHELRLLCRDVKRNAIVGLDALLVGSDANSDGFRPRLASLKRIADELPIPSVYAVPDPHVERWLLLDSAAFKAVFGKGCDAPDRRFEKQRYKQLLRKAITDAGHSAPMGGIEYAEDLVAEMDLDRVARDDVSFSTFLKDLRTLLTER